MASFLVSKSDSGAKNGIILIKNHQDLTGIQERLVPDQDGKYISGVKKGIILIITCQYGL